MAGGVFLANSVLLDVGVTLGLSAGILVGVSLAQTMRARLRTTGNDAVRPPDQSGQPAPSPEPPERPKPTPRAPVAALAGRLLAARILLRSVAARAARPLAGTGKWRLVQVGTAAAGVIAIVLIRRIDLPRADAPTDLVAAIGTALCLVAAGLAATVVRYLSDIGSAHLPEGGALCRGSRIVAWVFVVAAASIGLEWAELPNVARALGYGVVLINAAVCYGLVALRPRRDDRVFPVDLGVLTVLGSRANMLASVLAAAEAQLGIDLRSTWALMVVRRVLEPLVIGLALLGWCSTSLTVVGLDEEGLVERLGVPLGGQPLQPGLHLHLPWPVDKIFRLPVQRVQTVTVGREGSEERQGPENVVWARQHADTEYTLLLGNGRDLITMDAVVQFRITDARAWRYHSQNPQDALRAIAHRAVMTTTVNRTLAEVLSENLVVMTARMRALVQQDADALGLGVQILAFTVNGMHPPVLVAPDYQAVISAELGKVTAVVNANAFRNRTVPEAETMAVVGENAARAEGAGEMAKATGEAWSFLALQSQYRAAPGDYMFRRRLETLEKGLVGRKLTVVDARFLRDGGELWLTR